MSDLTPDALAEELGERELSCQCCVAVDMTGLQMLKDALADEKAAREEAVRELESMASALNAYEAVDDEELARAKARVNELESALADMTRQRGEAEWQRNRLRGELALVMEQRDRAGDERDALRAATTPTPTRPRSEMNEFPDSIINTVVEALNRVVPNEDGVMWIYECEDGERQPVTLYNAAIDVLRSLEYGSKDYASQYRALWLEEKTKREMAERELAKIYQAVDKQQRRSYS